MTFFREIKRFLVEKFWRPIADESVFYNPYNTAVYSGLFAVVAAYIGFPALKKMDISLNKDFFIGITPYIFLGGALRSLKDINIVNNILLETPFIYILMFVFTFSALYISKKIDEITGIEYHKIFGGLGTIIVLAILPLYSLNNLDLLYLMLGTVLVWSLSGYTVLKLFKPEILTSAFIIPVSAHFMDATVTAVAVGKEKALEKHVVGRFFIENFGPSGMFLMKTLIIIPAVYYIIENFEGDEKRYYLFLIALLGIGITTRNFLSIVTLTS